MIKTDQVAPDGTRHGDPIPGSRFFRDFCTVCGEPMRVTGPGLSTANFCCTRSPQPRPQPLKSLDTPDADPDAFAKALDQD